MCMCIHVQTHERERGGEGAREREGGKGVTIGQKMQTSDELFYMINLILISINLTHNSKEICLATIIATSMHLLYFPNIVLY